MSHPTNTPVTQNPSSVTQNPSSVTQTSSPVTQTPSSVTQNPSSVTQTPSSVTQTPSPVTQTPSSVTQNLSTVTKNPKATKKDLKEVKQYLDNIGATKIEQVYGVGQYRPWHGDGKSQSRTNITFQTKSQKTSGQPPQYITIVARKGKTDAYVTHTSGTWDPADKIIEAMLSALEQGVRVSSGIESTSNKGRVPDRVVRC